MLACENSGIIGTPEFAALSVINDLLSGCDMITLIGSKAGIAVMSLPLGRLGTLLSSLTPSPAASGGCDF